MLSSTLTTMTGPFQQNNDCSPEIQYFEYNVHTEEQTNTCEAPTRLYIHLYILSYIYNGWMEKLNFMCYT